MNLRNSKEKLKLAHQAVMLQDAQQILQEDRANTKWHNRKHREQPQMPDDDGNIHIGDVIHPQASNGSSKLLKSVLLGAALLGTGGLGAAAVAFLGSNLLLPQASQPQPSVPDSEYEVRFYDKDGNLISVPHISKKP